MERCFPYVVYSSLSGSKERLCFCLLAARGDNLGDLGGESFDSLLDELPMHFSRLRIITESLGSGMGSRSGESGLLKESSRISCLRFSALSFDPGNLGSSTGLFFSRLFAVVSSARFLLRMSAAMVLGLIEAGCDVIGTASVDLAKKPLPAAVAAMESVTVAKDEMGSAHAGREAEEVIFSFLETPEKDQKGEPTNFLVIKGDMGLVVKVGLK